MGQAVPLNDLPGYGSAKAVPADDLPGFKKTAGPPAVAPAKQEPENPISFGNLIGAALEPSASMATGAIAQPLAGLAGLASPLWGGNPADTVRSVQNALTYQPQTTGGQNAMKVIGYPFQKFAEGADVVGSKLAEHGHPVLGTIANTAIQAAPQIAAQYGMAKGMPIPKGELPPAPKMAATAARNATRDATLAAGKDAGYVVPVGLVEEGSTLARGLEGIAGRHRVENNASIKNSQVTAKLAGEDFPALGKDQPLTMNSIDQLREDAYKVYDNIIKQSYGTKTSKVPAPHTTEWDTIPSQISRPQGILMDEPFKAKVMDAYEQATGPHQEAPGVFKKHPRIEKERNDLLKGEMTPSTLMQTIRKFRASAKKEMANPFDPDAQYVGGWHLSMAREMENLLDRNLERVASPMDVDMLKKARTTIAKSHDYEAAMNLGNGEIMPDRLAALRKKGRPLSGNAALIADMYEAFPRAMRNVSRTPTEPIVTPFDWMYGVGSLASGHPGMALTEVVGRNLGGAGTLIRPINKRVTKPNYQKFGGGKTGRRIGRALPVGAQIPPPPDENQ